ncbi:MAG: LPS export ABC transporter permease LptF [Nitrospiraceae bacterium]|nr:MAG: LPS export ABC transporter permease LptF [Nitrospiraceae bacterium]
MIIHRTIFRELFVNLTVIICSLSIILFMEKFVRITRLFMGRGAEIKDIVKIFIYLQPSILLLSVPMALLIAIFLVYGRMSTDSEVIVLKGCGMSFFGISGAAVALSVLFSLILLYVSLYLLPIGMVSFKKTLYETIVRKASMTFEEETFSDVFKGNVIYVKEVPSINEFRGIFVYRDADGAVKDPLVIVAEKGTFRTSPEEGLIKLTMNNGLIHTFSETSSSEITFSQYDLVLASGLETDEKSKPEEIKTLDLWKGRNDLPPWAVELHRRVALPFACIIFGILGPALSSRMGKVGRLGGLSLSLGVLVFYYLLLIVGESFVKAGKVPAFWGAWTPNIFFGLIAGIFFFRAYKDRPVNRF